MTETTEPERKQEPSVEALLARYNAATQSDTTTQYQYFESSRRVRKTYLL